MKLTKDQLRLNRDQVKHVAKLANLPLSNEEVEKYSEQLSKILEYIDKLNEADTKDVESTFNVSGSFNKFRTDEASESLSQDETLSNVSKKENGFFITKGVFKEEYVF